MIGLQRCIAIGLLAAAALTPPSAAQLLADPPAAEQNSKETLRSLYHSRSFESKSGGSLPYRILTPATIEPNKKYPLVLFLHGAGERGVDNVRQLVHGAHEFARADRREQFPAFVVFPQCPPESRWVQSDWDLKSGRGQFPSDPSDPMRLTLELVDELSVQQPIDDARRYVTGLSMGGQGTWYAAAQQPHRFAAMLEVCGGGDPDWAKRYSGIPIWAFHGQADTVVPVSRGREMIAALAQVGHAPEIRYVEYPGVGHDAWTRTYSRDDVFQWLFAKRQP
ncbi:MAG: phospholipase [Pirellulaceae bacterium]|nr:phospholipase [Pirellulaceae bacterium]